MKTPSLRNLQNVSRIEALLNTPTCESSQNLLPRYIMKTSLLLLLGIFVLTAGALLPAATDRSADPQTVPVQPPAADAPDVEEQAGELAEEESQPEEAAEPEAITIIEEEPVYEFDTVEEQLVPETPASDETPIAEQPELADLARRIEAVTAKYSLGIPDIVRLVQGGVDQQVVLAYIKSSQVPFTLTSQQVLQMHTLGVSPDIIKAIIDRGIEVRTEQAQSFREQQERLAQQRQQAAQAMQAAYARPQNTGAPAGVPTNSGQSAAYNNGFGSGSYNNNYVAFPSYNYAVVRSPRRTINRRSGTTQKPFVPYVAQQARYAATVPHSTFKRASTFRWALPNTSYRSAAGYTQRSPAVCATP